MHMQTRRSTGLMEIEQVTRSVIVVTMLLLLHYWPLRAQGVSHYVGENTYRSSAPIPQTSGDEATGQPIATTASVTVTAPASVLVVIAGQHTIDDPVQPNIYHVTNAVYRRFVEQGYDAQHIFYLANDPTLDATGDDVADVDATATISTVRQTIISETVALLGTNGMLTLYLVGNSGPKMFYLNPTEAQTLTAIMLHEWLSQVEAAVPGVQITLMNQWC